MGNPVDEYLRIRKRADMWLDRGPKLLAVVEMLVHDLPSNKDWLDPTLEAELRAAIAACKEIGDA